LPIYDRSKYRTIKKKLTNYRLAYSAVVYPF
jgi:hypothetical protein